MNKLLLFLIFQIGIILFAYSQSAQFSDPYNLNLDIKRHGTWVRFFPTAWHLDTTLRIDGKPSLKIFKSNFWWLDISEKLMFVNSTPQRQFPFVFSFYQQLFLPVTENNDSDIRLSVTSQSFGIPYARLGVAGFDSLERMIYADSLDLIHENRWATEQLSFKGTGLKYLKIGIYGGGDPMDTMRTSALWLDRIKLIVNGKDISEYPQLNDTCIDNGRRLNLNRVHTLSSTDMLSLKGIASYADPKVRIFGFGESFHGGEDIGMTIYEHMKYLIKYKNCKVVLFENKPQVCLKWDLYARGLTSDSLIHDIREDIRQSKITLQGTSDFLMWLRDYNRTQSRKVRVRGIDIATSVMDGLFDYLSALQSERKDKAFYSLIKAVTVRDFDNVFRLLESDQPIRSLLGDKEYSYLVDVIKLGQLSWLYYADTVNGADYVLKYWDKRDYFMSEKVKWSFENDLLAGEKLAIYAHSGHVGKLPAKDSRIPQVPNNRLGTYLKEAYGSGYVAFSVQTGGGTFQEIVSPFGTQEDGKLEIPPPNTFESAALATGVNYFFCKTIDIPRSISYLRYIPNSAYKTQFNFAALREKYDGLIFIKNNRAIKNGVANGFVENKILADKRYRQRMAFLQKLEEANKE